MPYAGGLAILVSLAVLASGCDGRQSQPAAHSPALSAPKPSETTASSDRCALPDTEEALLQCRRNEHTRVENSMRGFVEALGTAYQKEAELMAAFTTAQEKWMEFRDAECKLRTYDSRDGTAFESYWLECLTALDEERITVLQYMKEHP